MPQPVLTPVDHDPFATGAAAPNAGPILTPVDHDPFATAPAAAASPTASPKLNAIQTINGALDNVLRGTGIGDELAGGWRMAAQTLMGHPTGFSQAMAQQRGEEDAFANAHPIVAGNARGLGMGATMLVPGGAATQSVANSGRAANMARGAATAAGTAAAYGLADRGTPQERVQNAVASATNPLMLALGAGAGALAPAARKAVSPSDAQTLENIGVQTSLPQKMGKTAKALEDVAMRFPILGQAVSASRDRQIEQLNRGVALKALEPIGETLPANIKPGFATVDHVDKALGAVYDQAAAMVPHTTIDAPFMADLSKIQQRAADLPDTEAKQFQSIVSNRLSRLADDSSGKMVKQVASEIEKLRGEAARKGQTTLADMLGDTRRSLMGVIGRSSPEAGDLINKADQGWQLYSIMNDAAASASNRGGVFLPGQLNTQVRAAGRRIGSNMTGKGAAPMQDIATAASRVLPDSFGNPGTANAVLASGALTGVGGALIHPALAAPVAVAGTGLGAASVPYFLASRKVLESLPGKVAPPVSTGRLPPDVLEKLLRITGVTAGSNSSPAPSRAYSASR